MSGFFLSSELLSQDPALVERMAQGLLREDIPANNARGLPRAFGKSKVGVDLPLDRPLAVICAAGDIAGPRLEAFNEVADQYCVFAAGAGAYTLPSKDGGFDSSKNIEHHNMHAFVSNFSVGNSHTRPAGLLSNHQVAFLASHCASEDMEAKPGVFNQSTIEALDESENFSSENIRVYDALLCSSQKSSRDASLIGTGTGAPTAAVTIYSALRQQAGLKEPLDITLVGFDGTNEMLSDADIPDQYAQRLKDDDVLVRIDGQVFKGQATFLAQTKEMIHLAHSHSNLIASIKVDGDKSFNARIFNDSALPRKDFEVGYAAERGVSWQNAYPDSIEKMEPLGPQ